MGSNKPLDDSLKYKPKLMEKRWDTRKELELLETWRRENIGRFKRELLGKKPLLVIDTPPPYPSGKWHVGGAAHYVQHDIIARYFRLRGYNVLMPFYADRNGLPVEVTIEKKYGINPHEMASTVEGREKFLEMCRKHLDKMEAEITNIWSRLGCTFEYWKNGTDSLQYRMITQATFIDLWKKGLIFVDERPVNWCPRCRTSLSDAELEYKQKQTTLYYINFRIKETGEKVTVATTRPELLGGCRALIYNPEDERYKHLENRTAIAPIYGHEMKILPHPQADPEFGTGLVMICSYGDQADIRLFRELNLKPEILIDKNGIMNEKAGPLKGLSIKDARDKIEKMLEETGDLVKKENIIHNTPVCWRCGTPIEFIHVKEYFLKQIEFKEKLLEVIEKIKFYPEMHKKKLVDWINSINSEWPISRDRYYATEIPVWKCRRCNRVILPEKGKYYQPWKDKPPVERCPHCGAPLEEIIGEKKVFDTWFDSSISALYVTGYMRDEELYEKAKDNVLRPQGYEIIRTWLYFSLLRIYQLTGKPAFKYVRITGMGLDEKGEAMHKSKGNVIDPVPIIEKYGADAFRYWAAASARVGYDYRFSEQLLKTGKLFATKLWNIARFVSMFPEKPEEKISTLLDRAIVNKLWETLREYIKGFEEMDSLKPTQHVYNFAWNIFASHYIELAKRRAYNMDGKWSVPEQESAWATMHYILKHILIMASPIMPFVTDEIWRRLYGGSVHKQILKDPPEPDPEITRLMDDVIRVNSEIWSYKKKNGIRLRDPIKRKVYLPSSLKPLEKEIQALHNLELVTFTDKPPEDSLSLGKTVFIQGMENV